MIRLRLGICLVLILALFGAPRPAFAAAGELVYVGGNKTAVEGLILNLPPGWFRLDEVKGRDKNQHWFIFLTDADRLDASRPTARVTVTDEKRPQGESAEAFDEKNKKEAAADGWSALSFRAAGRKRFLFRRHFQDRNTDGYYLPVSVKGRVLLVSFTVDGRGAEVPPYLADFVQGAFEPASGDGPWYPRDAVGKNVRVGDFLLDVPKGWVRAAENVENRGEYHLLLAPAHVRRGRIPTLKIARYPQVFSDAAAMKRHFESEGRRIEKAGGTVEMVDVAGAEVPALFDIDKKEKRVAITFLPNRDGWVYPVTVTDWRDDSTLPPATFQDMIQSLRFAEKITAAAKPPEGKAPKAAEERVPLVTPLEILSYSNILYNGDIDEGRPLGKETKAAHAELAKMVEKAGRDLDAAYDRLAAANRDFLARAMNLSAELESLLPKGSPLRKDVRAHLEKMTGVMLLESRQEGLIKGLRAALTAGPGPAASSLEKSSNLLTLLGLYAQAADLQDVRVKEIYPIFTALWIDPQSPLPADARGLFGVEVEKALGPIEKAMLADLDFEAAQAAAAYGLTGLKETFRLSLEKAIGRLADEIRAFDKTMKDQPPDDQALAQSLRDVNRLYKLQVNDLDAALKKMDADSKAWFGMDKVAVMGPGPGSRPVTPAAWKMGRVPIRPAVYSGYEPVAQPAAGRDRTFNGVRDNVVAAADDSREEEAGEYRRNEVSEFFGRMKGHIVKRARRVGEVVQKTVGAAAATIKLNAAAMANTYYGIKHGTSISEGLRDTLKEHQEEIRRGAVGRKAMREGIESLAGLEKGAEDLAKQNVEDLTGKGWTPWLAGKAANAAMTGFTGLPKGLLQMTARDATPGERVEGLVNVTSALWGVSGHVTKPVGQGAGKLAQTTGKALSDYARRSGLRIGAEEAAQIGEEAIEQSAKGLRSKLMELIRNQRETLRDMLKSAAEGGREAFEARLGDIKRETAERIREIMKSDMGHVLDKFSDDSLFHGALDNWIADMANQMTDDILAEEKEKEPDAENEYDPNRQMILDLLERHHLPPEGLLEPLADLWANSGQAVCEERIFQLAKTQGTFKGTLSGQAGITGQLSGSLFITVAGNGVTGNFTGHSSTGDTFSGKISGALDIWTGELSAKYSGMYNWVMGKTSGHDPMSGPFNGNFNGAGYSGTWSGKAQGTWSAK